MRVFVSSVTDGYEQYRAAARAAIEASGHVAVVIGLNHHASPSSPRAGCFSEIEDSDVLVLLLGKRYGDLQSSGKSATHEEWAYARSIAKRILVFVEDVEDREDAQRDLLSELGGWVDGSLWSTYDAPTVLITEIVKALRALEGDRAPASALEAAERLPPVCRERIEALRAVDPSAADLLVGVLSDPASRQSGALSHLADDPPGWLAGAGHTAWEAISGFLDAHGLPGADPMRMQAVEAGSPHSGLHLVRQAVATAENGDSERAENLLSQVPPDHPLLEAGRAHARGTPTSAVEVIRGARLHESDDVDLARYSVATLVWAYWLLQRPESAVEVLRQASRRFPDGAWIHLQQANMTLAMVDQVGLDSSNSHDLLSEAAELALKSRDLFRSWDGPSHLAVVIAMQALLVLADPQRVIDLGLSAPTGEATTSEAADPEVQGKLAHAYLMLGRFSDVDTLRLDRIDPSESALIRAMQARGLDDPSALSRMRRAVIQADDVPSRRGALLGLAQLGEVDAEEMSRLSPADSALLSGVAALSQGDYAESTRLLEPYHLESSIHASYLAQAQQQAGAVDEAMDTLLAAAARFMVDSLYEPAVVLLIDQGRLDEAASIAADAQARSPSRSARHRYGTLLAAIAERRQDWQGMESHARAVVRESPQDSETAWAVVYALHRQVKNQDAWAYVVAHDLVATNEELVRLTAAVGFAADASEEDADRLLQIAETFSESEHAAGSALLALMARGDRLRLSDEQRARLSELTEDFLARYPESDVFRTYSGEAEELVEIMTADQRERVERLTPLLNRVRHGQLPYGVLRQIRELPYAELLLSRSAMDITAISADQYQRDRERCVVKEALEGTVAVDTSVVALGIHSELDVGRMGTAFGDVLVADELLIDARMAVASARRLADGVFGYDSGLGQPTFSEIDDHQRAAARERAERALGMLSGWKSVRSGDLPPPPEIEEDHLRPWDAAIRVALSNGCALWCDDLALRCLAQSVGVNAFGTWALFEVLSPEDEWAWLPETEEIKLRLLRAQITDVPISLPELSQPGDTDEEPDIAAQLFLRRPYAWSENLAQTHNWYLRLFRTLVGGPHRQLAPGLLYAASYGLAAAVEPSERQGAIGSLLASSLAGISDPELVPILLAAARYAVRELDPAASLDPLEDTVRHLLAGWEPAFGAGPAAQAVRWLFSRLESDDRRTVMAIVLGNR